MESQITTTPTKRTPTNGTPKRKRSENTLTEKSVQHFHKVSDEELLADSSKTHICKHCGQKYNGSKEWNLVKHLQFRHSNVYNDLKLDDDTPEVKRLKLLQNCTEIVGKNGRTFTYLLDSGFQAIIKGQLDELQAAGYGLNLTNQNLSEVKEHLHKTSQQIQEKIRKESENRPVSLMVDIVTRQRRAICGISIQYIIGDQLKMRSIGMVELLHSHTAKYIAEVIIKRLNDYGIKLKQIIAITTDNGANMLKMVRDINVHLQAEIEKAKTDSNDDQMNERNEIENDASVDEYLQMPNFEDEISDDDAIAQLVGEIDFVESTFQNQLLAELSAEAEIHEITGIHCAAHTLQLSIKDAMSKIPEKTKNVVELCRRVSKFLRLKSISGALAAINIAYTLPRLENDTRWGSLYQMVSNSYSL